MIQGEAAVGAAAALFEPTSSSIRAQQICSVNIPLPDGSFFKLFDLSIGEYLKEHFQVHPRIRWPWLILKRERRVGQEQAEKT